MHVGGRIEGGIVIVGQREGHVDGLIPIVCAADAVVVVPGAAPGDLPIGVGAIGHDGVDVGIDGAGNDPLVGRQALRDDKRVERRQEGVGLGRDGRQRGDGEVARSREREERGRILLDRGQGLRDVVLQVTRHGPHGVGDVAKLCELGVERPQGEEILADGEDLLRPVEHRADERTHARRQEAQPDGQGREDVVERAVGRLRGIQHADYGGHAVGRRRSRVPHGGPVGIEEFPNGIDVVRHVEVLDAELLALKGRPVGRRARGAGDADAVIVAEFDGPEETLSEGLTSGAFSAVLGPPIRDVLADGKLIPACRVDGVHTCAIVSQRGTL